MKFTCCNNSGLFSDGGFSLVEVLVAMLLIAVALVPALQALQTGVLAAKVNLEFTQETPAAKMEQVLARSFSSLELAAKSGGNALGSQTTPIEPYDPNINLANPLAVTPLPRIPPGPGLSDDKYAIYIDCLDPATGSALIIAPCKTLLRIKVVAKNTGQQLIAYKAR